MKDIFKNLKSNWWGIRSDHVVKVILIIVAFILVVILYVWSDVYMFEDRSIVTTQPTAAIAVQQIESEDIDLAHLKERVAKASKSLHTFIIKSKMENKIEGETMDKDRTYIYDALEVKWTGRKASKKKDWHRTKSITTIYEITPIDPESGSWKKWVKEEDLYKIEKE